MWSIKKQKTWSIVWKVPIILQSMAACMSLWCLELLNVQLGAKTHFTVGQLPAHLSDLYMSPCRCCLQDCGTAVQKSLEDFAQHFFIILLSSTPSSSHYVVKLHHSRHIISSQTGWQHNDPITTSQLLLQYIFYQSNKQKPEGNRLLKKLSNRFNLQLSSGVTSYIKKSMSLTCMHSQQQLGLS